MAFAQRFVAVPFENSPASVRNGKARLLDACVRRATLPAALLLAAVFAPVARGHNAHESRTGQSSDINALPAAAQTRISAALGRDQQAYHSRRSARGLRMENSRRGLAAEFSTSGVDFVRGGNRWGMALTEVGCGNKLDAVKRVTPSASANRVEYRHGAITEWYVNGPLGFEQGFTITRKADGSRAEPLTVALLLSGNLNPSLEPGGHGLILRKGEAAVLRYSGLAAVDASGRELRAWLELSGERVRIHVDDARAQYPVTIDPMV